MKHQLVIFASGNGSNAENLIQYFHQHENIRVKAVYTNNPQAGVIQRCQRLNVPCRVFNKSQWQNGEALSWLFHDQATCLVLAGFLWLVPKGFITAFSNNIINIHPSLLPKYGGKGMFGTHVHEAVLNAGEKQSGITIHLVNEEYDKGTVLFQKNLNIENISTAAELAFAIHQLEHQYFAPVIEAYLLQQTLPK